MKKLILCAIITCISLCTFSQSFERISATETITWFGLDFSNAVMMGSFTGPIGSAYGYHVTTMDDSEVKPEKFRNQLYQDWNNVVLNEPEKFDLRECFGNKDVKYNIKPTEERNSSIDLEKIKVNGVYTYAPFDEEKLQSIVGAYESYIQDAERNGIGVSFIVEKFDKSNTIAVFNVVFFDLSNCDIIFYDRIEMEPSGTGIRNYWTGSIYKTLKLIRKQKWKKWMKNRK